MSIKEKIKAAIKGKLEESNVSPIVVIGPHGISGGNFGKRSPAKDFVLDMRTGDFYEDDDIKKSKWACPRCGRKSIFEKEDGRFHCECGGIFDPDLVVGNKVV